jgi:antirestriction protein ArdC
MKNKEQIYEKITQKIIKLLEAGDLEWLKSWKSGLPKSYSTKSNYRGINAFLLNIHMISNKFKSPYYLTFKQVKKLGGSVKAGSHGEFVIYYDFSNKIKRDVCKTCGFVPDYCKCNVPKEKVVTETRFFPAPVIKSYYVFNIEQTTLEVPEEEKKEFNPIEKCEKLVKGYSDRPEIRDDPHKAFYNPLDDYIGIPFKSLFDSEENYYSTLFHEMIHSTGHQSRLNREGIVELKGFGGETYSKEEVIAELGNAFLCAEAGIENKTLKNNSAYIKHWLGNMRKDNSFIFRVVAQSQKAVSWIMGQANPETKDLNTKKSKIVCENKK